MSVPPQVLAQYQSVNDIANSVGTQPTTTYTTQPVYAMGPDGQYVNTGETQQVAQHGTEIKPFQTYGGEFVAPVNAEQNAGIAGTNAAAGEAQPYFDAATGTLGQTQAGANAVNSAAESGTAANAAPLSGDDINRYLSPYLGDVLGSTSALINQNNQQQQAGQLGSAIRSGAFGGDRTGIAAANLEQQQNLANANIYSGISNQGYQSALSTAQGQQQIGLAGAKQLADIGSTAYGEGANTATTLAGLGTGAQSAGLQGAQAKIAAGTVQQQTQQAQDTAQYQQFLQQQSYPFQVAQFLANIAEGTGALSGSTTTTQQPGGFFSDERLKEDMEPIGKTFDGQPIYRYRMKGDDREQIGLSAQKVEKRHPDAVGLKAGYKFVDYGKATDAAANRGHFYTGGVTRASLHERRAYAYGGGPDDSSGGLGAVLAAQQGMYSDRGSGPAQRNIPTGGASHQLAVAQGTPAPPPSGSNKVSQTVGLGKDAYQGYKWLNKPSPTAPASHGVAGPGSQTTTYTPGLNSMPDAAVPQQPGVTTNFEAGPGTTTTFDTAPVSNSAGLGAADTSAATGAADTAATDAAATGATQAAAGSAAESAATGAAAEGAAGAAAGTAAGAATGAVAAGAADAAATEAAALAAEYAATYAAMAAVAAKRGGRINSRGKFASGGSPYETTYQLEIPDEEQSGEHLQSPGPLQKQPTGLQTAMKMGDPNQWEGLASSMSSNTALATGGVAGRRGYDDGGAPEQDSDPGDVMPDAAPTQIASDSDRGAGVVGVSKHPWLDKIKKNATAENVIPILSGLAAMGTAPTRSAGVALAAGLGAGAQSYLGTRASLAKTAEEQQKVRELDIANQLAGLKLGVAKDALSPSQSSAVIPRQAATQMDSATDTASGLDAQYRRQFFVNKARTPEEQAAKDAAIKKDWSIGGDMFQKQADIDYQARVERDLQNSRNQAQQMADARRLQYQQAKTDGEKQVALAHYNALRQWTGDESDIQGGIVKNKRTGQPEIGGIAQQGFTPAEESRFMDMALAPMDVRNPDGSLTQMEAWKAHGAASPAAYAQSLKVNSTASPSQPRVSTRPAAASAPAAAPTGPVTAGPATAGPGVIGASQSPITLEQQRLNLAALESVRQAGDQAPNNRNINQQLLRLSDETRTGPATAAVQKIAAALNMPSGSRYQEINAYLDRQAATQAAVMGVPHTNAGLAASQTATGTTEYTPQALQEKVKYADAMNSGAMAYREGVDKFVGTGSHQDLSKYQTFRSSWARNFDPDVYRADDALRRGDKAELSAIRARLGSKGMKALAIKSANLRLLENGQIPQ